MLLVTGDITLWNEHEHEGSCASDGHKAPVNILSWSSNGTRLISGDEVASYFYRSLIFHVMNIKVFRDFWSDKLLLE